MNKLDKQEVDISVPAEKEESYRDALIHHPGRSRKRQPGGGVQIQATAVLPCPHFQQQPNLKPPPGRETESLEDSQWDFRDAWGTCVTW